MKKIAIILMTFLLISCTKNELVNDNQLNDEIMHKKEIDLKLLIDNYLEIYTNLSEQDVYTNKLGYMCKKYIGNQKTGTLINNVFYEINNNYVEEKNVKVDGTDNVNYSVYFCIPNNCKIIEIDDYSSYIIDGKSYLNISGTEYPLYENKLISPLFKCEFEKK